MIKIEINGVATEAEAGTTIIQVADKLAIPIPRFCYHRKLSVAANCRMCLVHVDKVPKALPACATPITEGMKVWTDSPIAIDAQKSVMEFLLINHPLDCPICDQGGECELQDVSMEYGKDFSRYTEEKRVVLDHDLGPLISTDMTRCILCTRCVRFGKEIAGQRELGVEGRGEMSAITSFLHEHVNSEVSGNIIDLCPVGALTSKPFRFTARAWELQQHAGISPHDSFGSNLYWHVLNDKVMRVIPQNSDNINEIWLSDRDRFSYQALRHEERLRQPLLFKHDNWAFVSWVEALKYSIAGLKLAIDSYGRDQVGVLVSPSVSTEEYFLLQKLMRDLGVDNIDHRLRQQDFREQNHAPLMPNLGVSIAELEQQDAILLIGSHIHKELPIAGIKLRKMTLKQGKVFVLNPVDFHFNFAVTDKIIAPGADMLSDLAAIAKQLLILTGDQRELLVDVQPNAAAKQLAEQLLAAGNKRLLILGQLALMHPQSSLLVSISNLIAELLQAKVGTLSDGANAAGAWLAGCVPHRLPGGKPAINSGKNALEMLNNPLKCYVLYAIEPEFDSVLGDAALETLRQADFVIVISAYQNDTLLEIADVFLPIAPYAETTGTLINVAGTWQTSAAAVSPFADSRPGWKVLRVLGNVAELPGFEYNSPAEIMADLKSRLNLQTTRAIPSANQYPVKLNLHKTKQLIRIAPIALYAVDNLVRRASALQKTADAMQQPTVQINPIIANNLGLIAGEIVTVSTPNGTTQLPVEINSAVPESSVVIYQANKHTNMLGSAYAAIEVSKCQT